MINTYSGGVRATGGAISPGKCFWALLNHEWTAGRHSLSVSRLTPGQLKVKDINNNEHIIRRLEPDEAEIMLGVHISLDFGMNKQMTYMRTKAESWARQIRRGHLNRLDSWRALQFTIWRTLTYPLPATTLTESQCQQVMSPVLQAGLPSAGIARSIHRDVIFAPRKYHGGGIAHLYTTQGIAKLESLISHNMQDSVTRHLFQACIEGTMLEVGVGDVFSSNYKVLHSLATGGIIKSTWEFCWKNNIKIVIPDPAPLLEREHDRFITDVFVENGFTGAQLYTLNQCRVYLEALTVSDISSADGLRLENDIRLGKRLMDRPSRFTWPESPRPSTKCWTLWESAINQIFGPRSSTLRQPLGQWLQVPRRWTWFYS